MSRWANRRCFFSVLALMGAGLADLSACGQPTAPAAYAPAAGAPTSAPASARPSAAPAAAPTAAGAAAAATPAAGAKVGGAITWLVRTNVTENKAQETIFLPAIKKAYPDLEVDQVVVPANDYIPKINTMAAGGKPPDIWGFGGSCYDDWARVLSGPPDEFIAADTFDIDNYFLPGLPDKCKVGGKHFCLCQLTTFGTFTIYNKKIVDEGGVAYTPSDWADTSWNNERLLEIAHKLTKTFGKPDA